MPLWFTASSFHLGFSAACLRVARRWTVRLASPNPPRFWVRMAVVDAVQVLAVAVLLATLGAFVGPRSGFTAVRLLAQGLFGETILLTCAITCLPPRDLHPRGRLLTVRAGPRGP